LKALSFGVRGCEGRSVGASRRRKDDLPFVVMGFLSALPLVNAEQRDIISEVSL